MEQAVTANKPLLNQRIVLGITGSIACYKSADLATKLAQLGAEVDTVLTRAATEFVSPLTFQSVTGRRAYTDEDLWGHEAHVLHIGLAHDADLLLVAPASAHTMAKLAHGLAEDLLSVTALAATCPLVLAPAMDAGMYSHAATQANVRTLEERGAVFIGPEEGHLASGLVAKGRMTEPADILGRVRYLLDARRPAAGAHDCRHSRRNAGGPGPGAFSRKPFVGQARLCAGAGRAGRRRRGCACDGCAAAVPGGRALCGGGVGAGNA